MKTKNKQLAFKKDSIVELNDNQLKTIGGTHPTTLPILASIYHITTTLIK